MTEDVVAVDARYDQVFEISHLHVAPEVAGLIHEFNFEDRSIDILIPQLMESETPSPHHRSAATISVKNAAGEPLTIDIAAIRLTIKALKVAVPESVSRIPHIDAKLYTKEQKRELDEKSNRLYFLADRAIHYWLRVVRWKTGFYAVRRPLQNDKLTSDGGALINESTGTRFYTPLVSRTIVLPAAPVLSRSHWDEIKTALQANHEPPVWREYLISAQQRIESRDRQVAVLDLAIAAEASIRTHLEESLPPRA